MVCVTEITDYCQTYLEALVQWKQDGCTSKKREENHNTILHIVLREIMQPIDMDCVLANHCFKRWFIFSHHSLFTFLYILPVKYVIFYFLNLHITITCNLTQRKNAQYQNNHANFTVQNTHTNIWCYLMKLCFVGFTEPKLLHHFATSRFQDRIYYCSLWAQPSASENCLDDLSVM